MLNKIVIVGRMTKDAKIYDNEEVKIATFSVATERNYKDENDEIACDYIFCKAFGKMASNIEKIYFWIFSRYYWPNAFS